MCQSPQCPYQNYHVPTADRDLLYARVTREWVSGSRSPVRRHRQFPLRSTLRDENRSPPHVHRPDTICERPRYRMPRCCQQLPSTVRTP